MIYTIKLLPQARMDIEEATQDYNLRKLNLGNELFITIAEAIDSLKQNPFLFQKRYRDLRQIHTTKFNFAVHYFIEEKQVIVIAVLHNSRNPQIWKNRTK